MSHDENEGGFVSHLAELRKRLIHSFIFLIIFFIGCYFFAEHLKIIIEPGGAVAATAALTKKIDLKNKNVVVMISGGNIDLDMFANL